MIRALPVGKLLVETQEPLVVPRVIEAKLLGAATDAVTAPSTESGPEPSPTASFPAESTFAKKADAEWSEMLTVLPTVANALPTSGLSRLPRPTPASTKSAAMATRYLVMLKRISM